MAKSNKPIVWGLFAAGGTVTAFLTPALVLLTLLPAFGVMPELMSYDNLRAFAGHWFGKLMVFGILFLMFGMPRTGCGSRSMILACVQMVWSQW